MLKEPDGKVSPIAVHNTINLGVLTFPYLTLAAALNDPVTTVSAEGLSQVNGRSAYQVRVQRHLFKNAEADSRLAKLGVTTYFLDAQTNLLLKTLQITHPNENANEDYPLEIEFENHIPIDGVTVPMLIREKFAGQTTWELRLTSFSANTGLTDFDFAIE